MIGKIEATHLSRRAVVYVRQSTAMQVFEHKESTTRQYALAERARALGWPAESVEVIDEDLGQSGATANRRSGFSRLADLVAHGDVGAILALEVSRLARNSQDWQQLLSLCAVAQVVVIDEQAVYDPSQGDDKLLLDLKGTFSEAELHWLGLRLTGARRSKARRGELSISAPTGYVWADRKLNKDPDEAVRHAIDQVFERFAVEPTAWAVVRWARESGYRIPTRRRYADGTGELLWKRLGQSRLCDVLRNPVYAGAYVYGRRCYKKRLVDGEIRRVVESPRNPEAWMVCLRGAHDGYITWETYLSNQERLRENDMCPGGTNRGAAREGAALLAGILICGRCGRRMRPHYWRDSRACWSYACAGDQDKGQKVCWSITGKKIDAEIEDLLLRTVVPSELELGLAVEREVEAQATALHRQWKLRLEQAEYESRRAERRYKAVDPDNRVVARTLENEWEQRLRELQEVEREYEQARRQQGLELSREDRARIRALAKDLPAVWRAKTTRPADRKAMLRLVIEEISLRPIEVPKREIDVQVQWQSGALSTLRVDWPVRVHACRTPAESRARLKELAEEGLHDQEIADRMNAERLLSGKGKPWTLYTVRWARRREGVERRAPDKPRRTPLPDRHPDGRYSIRGAMRRFAVSESVVRRWIRRGTVPATREDYREHRQVYWLVIDEETAKGLEKAVRRAVRRPRTKK